MSEQYQVLMLVVIPNDILKLVTDCGWGVFMQHIKNYKNHQEIQEIRVYQLSDRRPELSIITI